MPDDDLYCWSADARHATIVGVVDRADRLVGDRWFSGIVDGRGADYALPLAGVALVLSLMFSRGHAWLGRTQA